MRNTSPCRVFDRMTGDYGTAVEKLTKNFWRVEWDNPTPNQDTAYCPIPSRHFQWVVEKTNDFEILA